MLLFKVGLFARSRAASAWVAMLLTTSLFLLMSSQASAQARQERDGITLYWGLVPAALVSTRHALDDMHGGAPKDGGQVHHLVVALFDSAKGTRIEDAVVRAQLSEAGIADAPPKYLTPMPIEGQMSYGQFFSVAKAGPYRFRLWAKVPGRANEIEYAISANSPHVQPR